MKILKLLFHVGIVVALLIVVPAGASAQLAGDPKGLIAFKPGTSAFAYYFRHITAEKYESNGTSTTNNDYQFNYSLLRGVYYGELFGFITQYNVIVPYGSKQQVRNISPTSVTSRSTGWGDTALRAYLWILDTPTIKVVPGWNINVPTGKYHNESSVNIGANKWCYGPELGFAYLPNKDWMFELHTTATYSTDNDDYGTAHQRLATDPLFNATFHLIYNVNTNLFFAASGYWLRGGENQLEGVRRNNDINTKGTVLTAQIRFNFPLQILLQYGRDLEVKNGFVTESLMTRLLYVF